MARAVGIDLGTSYTVVATIEGGRPIIIPNAEGQCLTPSVVASAPGAGLLVGEPAKRQAAANPDGTVFSIKRRMGSDYRLRIAGKEYTPQEISGFILRKARADAEKHLGERIDQAVITVPAYFNDRQRQATREAGVLAGLDVLRVVNEPTAAALAYGLDREDVHTILVWDLGGGTFDVSILELGEGIFEVRAVSGDTWLGGDDIDQRLMDYLTGEYKRASGADFPADPGVRQRLREAAERAKMQLSSSPVAWVRLPLPGARTSEPMEVEIRRERLDSLVTDLLQRMAICAQQALADAGLAPEDIDRVVLVGGATRMPAVRDLVRKLMRKEPYRYVDPDEVVAMGAAIHAGMALGMVKRVALLDVLPLSLGVETQGGLMATIIPRNTPVPASGERIFTTAADYQTSMDIYVLQGERELASDNISLGQFQLTGIPSDVRGGPKVEVSFQADVDGIVHVSAKDLRTESQVKVKLSSAKALDSTEIEHLAQEAQCRAEQGRQERERIQAGIQAENVIAAAEMALNELARPILSEVEEPQVDPRAQRVIQTVAELRESLARGTTADMHARSDRLRHLLASIQKDRPRAAPSIARGNAAPDQATEANRHVKAQSRG